MKRIATIFFFILVPLFAMAQENELFTIERTYYVAGTSQSELSNRAYRWTNDMKKQYRTIHDYSFVKYAEALEFTFFDREIIIDGVKYRIDYNFSITIYPQDNIYTVKLERLDVSANRGVWGILSVESIPKDPDIYRGGEFGIKRRLSEKVAVAKEMQKIAAADFEYLLPSIREYMSGKR